eukprot:scaffold15231_cov66-Cyclotella_meneghiniana.AAC.3
MSFQQFQLPKERLLEHNIGGSCQDINTSHVHLKLPTNWHYKCLMMPNAKVWDRPLRLCAPMTNTFHSSLLTYYSSTPPRQIHSIMPEY